MQPSLGSAASLRARAREQRRGLRLAVEPDLRLELLERIGRRGREALAQQAADHGAGELAVEAHDALPVGVAERLVEELPGELRGLDLRLPGASSRGHEDARALAERERRGLQALARVE